MKRAIAVVVVLAIGVVIGWRLWPREQPPRVAAPQHQGATATASTVTPGAQPSRVRRLSPDERRALGDKIAAAVERARTAQAAGTTTSAAGPAPALPEPPSIPLEEAAKPLQQALFDAIPLLAECYEQRSGNRAAAMMTMASDPELGTVIDTAAITDQDGKPLDPKIDECLRNAIDSLALPPLGDRAGMLKVQYTFRFDE